jgi:hypothetical protein
MVFAPFISTGTACLKAAFMYHLSVYCVGIVQIKG